MHDSGLWMNRVCFVTNAYQAVIICKPLGP